MASEITSLPPASGQMRAAAKRIFSRREGDPPIPEYVNNLEFTSMGMDIFMDAGVVPPESIVKAMAQKSTEEETMAHVDFFIKFRFGMSIQTAMQMHQKLTQMLQLATTQAVASMDITGQEELAKED
jgi:hypothetical protein